MSIASIFLPKPGKRDIPWHYVMFLDCVIFWQFPEVCWPPSGSRKPESTSSSFVGVRHFTSNMKQKPETAPCSERVTVPLTLILYVHLCLVLTSSFRLPLSLCMVNNLLPPRVNCDGDRLLRELFVVEANGGVNTNAKQLNINCCLFPNYESFIWHSPWSLLSSLYRHVVRTYTTMVHEKHFIWKPHVSCVTPAHFDPAR